MKIVALNASPTKNGNCDKLIDEVLKGCEGHEIIKHKLDAENIKPCKSCRYCFKNPECIQNDDGNVILKELEECDALVFATPIFCGQMTAQAKLLTDRFFSIGANPDREINAKAYLIFTHNQEEHFYDDYIEYTKFAPFSLINFEIEDVLDVGDLKLPNDILKQENKLKDAYEMGCKIVK